MHGIFVGEIQALEGAGRTAFDYTTEQTPFAMKLDMARQCWDEARHVEISLLLGEHMGTDVGEYSEAVTLFEAACHPDPVFRLAGVNRALEGLAIDVFTTMRDFAAEMNDPVLYFAEDWMLADEVTHVKMGSTWLREVTKDDPDRQKAALEFQRTVDGLFNFRGMRGESREAAIRLARKFREMAGFATEEIDEIAAMAEEQRAERVPPRTDRSVDRGRVDEQTCAMTHPVWPLFDLRVVTPRLELRYVDDALAVELAQLAAQGHPRSRLHAVRDAVDRRRVAGARTQLDAVVLAVPGRDVDRLGSTCRWRSSSTGRPAGTTSLDATDFPVLRQFESGSWLGREFQGRRAGHRDAPRHAASRVRGPGRHAGDDHVRSSTTGRRSASRGTSATRRWASAARCGARSAPTV